MLLAWIQCLSFDHAGCLPSQAWRAFGTTMRFRENDVQLTPQAGRKVFALQTWQPVDIDKIHSGTVGQATGFNLNAGVVARADQRRGLERLCGESGSLPLDCK